jgi:large subunit ribosomal protein L25
MNTTVAATIRGESGKGAARKLRASGSIPGVMYGQGGEATPLALDPVALLDIFRKTRNRNTLLQIEIGGQTVSALVKETQRHPVSRDLLHVDLYRVQDGTPVSVKVPVKPIGRPAGASIGGRIELVRRDLWVSCLPNAIPEFVEVDVTPLEVGAVVKISQIPLPDGQSVKFDQDFPVLGCVGKKK